MRCVGVYFLRGLSSYSFVSSSIFFSLLSDFGLFFVRRWLVELVSTYTHYPVVLLSGEVFIVAVVVWLSHHYKLGHHKFGMYMSKWLVKLIISH